MPKVRVLVVDDAVVIRKILSEAISADPDLEVVATASNGKIALQKIPVINPDVVTLDIEMPEMNGIETLKEIRKNFPRLPVIMFSAVTEKGATATLDALAHGASDYVTKPSSVESGASSKEAVQSELIAKIKALAQAASEAPPSIVRQQRKFPPREIFPPVEAIAIGVSTGGPNALAKVVPSLPGDINVPIFITQHMPPMFTRMLAERLDSQSQVRVVEGADGMEVAPNTAYIAPGDFHMDVVRDGQKTVLKLHQGPHENSCRPAVDVMFRSAIDVYGRGLLGVILTGMGNDGARGCERLREVGGQVIVQDEETSVVWGMPGHVAENGLANAILPLNDIAGEIIRRRGVKS